MCLHCRGLCCSWRCPHHRGLSCTWPCLHYRGMFCFWRFLPQSPELYRRVCTTKACAATGGVYTTGAWASSERFWGICCSWRCLPQRPELNLEVSTVYTLGPELHLYAFNPQRPVPTSCWSCSLRLENNLPTVGHVRFAMKIMFLL